LTVTADELLMTASAVDVGGTPDNQSDPVDQSPDAPVIQYTDAATGGTEG
jgi:hypothetical protein